MALLNPKARELIESGALAHLVTLAVDVGGVGPWT